MYAGGKIQESIDASALDRAQAQAMMGAGPYTGAMNTQQAACATVRVTVFLGIVIFQRVRD